MEINTIENPFTGCTARDMTYDEISKYWCSPFELYHINETELMRCRTPIVIEGARGTGKTMLLKHLSYYIQKDFISASDLESKLLYFEEKGIGIYFRYKEDFCNMFKTLNCDEIQKQSIFICYYEFYITRQIVEILKDLYSTCDDVSMESQYAAKLGNIIGLSVDDFSELYDALNAKIRSMDNAINISIYNIDWLNNINEILMTNNIVKKFVSTINSTFEGWNSIQFNILLDEYENAREYQRVINTFFKQVDDTVNISYRIGMRPEGMFDNRTYVGDENLQIDRDFIVYPLNCMGDKKEYREFAIAVARKRLEKVEYYRRNNLVEISVFLGASENLDEEADSVAKNHRHFELIKDKFSNEEMKSVIETISCDEKLLEMYNILKVYRGTDYRDIGKYCREYLRIRGDGTKSLSDLQGDLKKYYTDYSKKYKMSMLYVLLSIYNKHKMYYSLNTFLYLSSGSINDFISLCRNTFYFMDSSVLEDVKMGKAISKKIQTNAAIRTANNQFRKISMSNMYGMQMSCFIDNLGKIFGEYNKDLKARYPETNQFMFYDENSIYQDNELNQYIVELINSGAIIKSEMQQNMSISREKGYKYKLNRIFAPKYEFSYRTRNGFNVIINKEEFYNMLNKTVNLYKKVENDNSAHQVNIYEVISKGGD